MIDGTVVLSLTRNLGEAKVFGDKDLLKTWVLILTLKSEDDPLQ